MGRPVRLTTSEIEAEAPDNELEFAFATLLAAVAHENELDGDDTACLDIEAGVEVFDAATGVKLGTWALVFFPEDGVVDTEEV